MPNVSLGRGEDEADVDHYLLNVPEEVESRNGQALQELALHAPRYETEKGHAHRAQEKGGVVRGQKTPPLQIFVNRGCNDVAEG